MANIIAKKGLGRFYEVSHEAINHVADHGNRAALVLAYLALKRHQQRNNRHVVSAGRRALVNTLGVSEHRAKKLLDELHALAWGPGDNETAVVDAVRWNQNCIEGDEVPPGRYKANKVLPPCGEDFIYLPNLLNTIGPDHRYSPIGQILRLSKPVALDTALLLLNLYVHLDMQHCGGVDPTTAICIPWRHEGTAYSDELLDLGYKGEHGGLHFWVVDMRSDDADNWTEHLTTAQWSFIESITGENPETGAGRFWAAWRALRDLGLAYHTAMVFDADPKTDPDAEILYPLWTFNRAERERLNQRGYGESGLAIEVQNRARRYLVDDVDEALVDAYSNRLLITEPSGFFIAAAPNPHAKVIGILRPRFIPNTQDARAGWASLRDKSSEWKSILEADK